jgi:hypothetical protein
MSKEKILKLQNAADNQMFLMHIAPNPKSSSIQITAFWVMATYSLTEVD